MKISKKDFSTLRAEEKGSKSFFGEIVKKATEILFFAGSENVKKATRSFFYHSPVHRTVRHCKALHSTALRLSAPCSAAALRHTFPYDTELHRAMRNRTAPYCTTRPPT